VRVAVAAAKAQLVLPRLERATARAQSLCNNRRSDSSGHVLLEPVAGSRLMKHSVPKSFSVVRVAAMMLAIFQLTLGVPFASALQAHEQKSISTIRMLPLNLSPQRNSTRRLEPKAISNAPVTLVDRNSAAPTGQVPSAAELYTQVV
jgi:hypothetical protein